MRHPGPKTIFGRASKQQRRQRRKHIDLEEASLSTQTRSRYYLALRLLLPILKKVDKIGELDERICGWIHRMWRSGEPLLTVGDALSALHFFQPYTKRQIPHSWKLFATWRRVEVPARAPQLTQQLVRSLAAYELSLDNIEMATCLILAFHALLRTGELLQATCADCVIKGDAGIIRLASTKTSKRFAADDALALTDPICIMLLQSLITIRKTQRLTHLPLWNGTPQAFRTRFNRLCQIFGLQAFGFRPYSLRRGGATALFQRSGSMEQTLLRGRWQNSRVARIYITDGLSYIPRLRPNPTMLSMTKKFFFINPQEG